MVWPTYKPPQGPGAGSWATGQSVGAHPRVEHKQFDGSRAIAGPGRGNKAERTLHKERVAEELLDVLEEIGRNDAEYATARISAINSYHNRVWGLPTQHIEVAEDARILTINGGLVDPGVTGQIADNNAADAAQGASGGVDDAGTAQSDQVRPTLG